MTCSGWRSRRRPGGAPEVLAAAEMGTGAPVFSADGRSLLTIGQDRVDMAEVPLKGKERDTTDCRERYGCDAFCGRRARNDRGLDDGCLAPEIYALGKALRKLTSHNDALMAQLNLSVAAEDLSAKASGCSEVHSLLTMPVGYQAGTKAPMLLFIHGGPTAQDSHRFAPDRQLLAAHGFAVLQVNYRGSTGRGHDYSYAINADWGDKEVKDCWGRSMARWLRGRLMRTASELAGGAMANSDGLYDCFDNEIQGGFSGAGT